MSLKNALRKPAGGSVSINVPGLDEIQRDLQGLRPDNSDLIMALAALRETFESRISNLESAVLQASKRPIRVKAPDAVVLDQTRVVNDNEAVIDGLRKVAQAVESIQLRGADSPAEKPELFLKVIRDADGMIAGVKVTEQEEF
jgi:hypothetical protein